MAGVAMKIQRFFGEAPKISPELLPDTVGQVVFNVDLSSGDILPYRRPEAVAALTKIGEIKTIYPMRNPVTSERVWLHWTDDVDVAVAQVETNLDDQRIYYTGDSYPKVTTYDLATSGPNYPAASYRLGLPLPSAVPVATATAFTQKISSTRSRDAGNTARIVTTTPHGLTTGAYVTTTGFGGTGYNLSNVRVTVENATTFTYFCFGAAEGATADAAGRVDLAGTTTPRNYVFTYLTDWDEESVPSEPSATIFVKEGQSVTVSNLPASWPHGAGYQTTNMKVRIYRTVAGVGGTTYFRVGEVALGTTSFVDNIDVLTLDEILTTEEYDPPEPTMTGLLAIHNNMMVGFFGNTLCFCEPGQPHAWPIKYRQTVDSRIVALGAYGTTLLVLTEKTPWVVDGNNPEAVSIRRTDYVLPCSSKRSVANVGFGVVWASAGGLAAYSTTIGVDYLTKNVHSWPTWVAALTPTNVYGAYYRGRYFGSDGNYTFIFERNEEVGGHLVQSDIRFTAAHYSAVDDAFFYAHDGQVFLWNSPDTGYTSVTWKSKVFTFKQPVNFGAARVTADYDTGADSGLAAENQLIIDSNIAMIATGEVGGALGEDEIGELKVASSRLHDLVDPDMFVSFKLYANRQLIYSGTRTADTTFRLPTGYRADTYEVEVSSNTRIRAIYLAETPAGLRSV